MAEVLARGVSDTKAPSHTISALPPTPGTSPELSALGSPPTRKPDDGAPSDGNFTSLSDNGSTVDAEEEKVEPHGSKAGGAHDSPSTIRHDLREAFSETILAKTCKVAVEALRRGCEATEAGDSRDTGRHAAVFPEYCPQTGSDCGQYVLREPEFWTCGFFPGTLFGLLERAIRFPESLAFDGVAPADRPSPSQIRAHLHDLCRAWSEPLHGMSSRTDTHDLGFIIMPALRADWELTSNPRSLASIVHAAHSLASRYVPAARAIRSWDLVRRRDMEITGMDDNLLLIIDSMCNLDLLYYAAAHSGDTRLADIATAHAKTLLSTHLRPEGPAAAPAVAAPSSSTKTTTATTTKTAERYTGQLYSTCHVANLDPRTGALKRRATAQGYADDSCWARGQAWAILGYAQTYQWTGDAEFLRASCGCAEYFLHRLETSPACVETVVQQEGEDGPARRVGRYVPLWDFDAPVDSGSEDGPTRDSSAGVIAANGMLVLSQALAGRGEEGLAVRFREAAVAIVRDTLDFALAREKVRFARPATEGEGGLRTEDVEDGRRFDALLKYGTANNNEFARKRYANHGLVYGDYYLVEFGNRLLRMGLV